MIPLGKQLLTGIAEFIFRQPIPQHQAKRFEACKAFKAAKRNHSPQEDFVSCFTPIGDET